MLLNVSYNDPKIKKQIDSEVGAPFSLRERWKLGGIGSSKLNITHASIDIHNLLVLDNNNCSCNIELRPKGIIVRFRSLLETYGLIIPFYKLNIHKEKSYQYSIFYESSFIKLDVRKDKEYSFFKKMMNEKASSSLRNPF